MSNYPNVFSPKYLDENLIVNIYAHVSTWCHGYGKDGLAVVPMADNINHSIDDVFFELMNVKQ